MTPLAYHTEQARRAHEAVQMIRAKAWHYQVDIYASTDQPLAWAFRAMQETAVYHAEQAERAEWQAMTMDKLYAFAIWEDDEESEEESYNAMLWREHGPDAHLYQGDDDGL